MLEALFGPSEFEKDTTSAVANLAARLNLLLAVQQNQEAEIERLRTMVDASNELNKIVAERLELAEKRISIVALPVGSNFSTKRTNSAVIKQKKVRK